MRSNLQRPSIPLFFKLWFGFIALIAVTIIGSAIYLGAQAISAGPEGIGRAIGSVIKGIDEARR